MSPAGHRPDGGWRRPAAACSRLWQRVRPTLSWTGRLTTAGVVAYLLTLALTEGPVDVTGVLTALLVVQASAYATVRMGLVRVGAVLTGVLVAVALSTWVGLTWWSLGAAIASSLLLAAVLRLGAQALETPISAMLVLAVGGQEIAAETRVLTTLIGAGVGVAFNLLLPPAVPTRAAVAAVRGVCRQQAECLAAASASMAVRPITKEDAGGWLALARSAGELAERAAVTVEELRDVRRLNARAIGTADAEPVLRRALESLGRSMLAVRALFSVIHKEAPEHPTPDDGYGDEVRAAFAVVLAEVAECVGAFGALVEAEVGGTEAEVERTLAENLEVARETRAILTELLFVDAREETSLWLLRGSILAAVEQILEPLERENRARLRREQEHEQEQRRAPGSLAGGALLVRQMLPADGARRRARLRRRLRRLLQHAPRPRRG